MLIKWFKKKPLQGNHNERSGIEWAGTGEGLRMYEKLYLLVYVPPYFSKISSGQQEEGHGVVHHVPVEHHQSSLDHKRNANL